MLSVRRATRIRKAALVAVVALVVSIATNVVPSPLQPEPVFAQRTWYYLGCDYNQGCLSIINSGPGGIIATVYWWDTSGNLHESSAGGWCDSEMCTWGFGMYKYSDRAPEAISCRSDSWCDITVAWCFDPPNKEGLGNWPEGLTLLSKHGRRGP